MVANENTEISPRQGPSNAGVLCVALLVGLIAGLVAAWPYLQEAYTTSAAQGYFREKLYRLIALEFRRGLQLAGLMSITVTVAVTCAFWFSRKLMSARVLSRFLAMIIVLLFVASLGVSGWVMMRSSDPAYSQYTRPPNLILIVVDTLRADHLGMYGYPRNTSPNIDQLAKESTWYRFANATSPWTLPSVASIFSCFYPTVTGINTHLRGDQVEKLGANSFRGVSLSDSFVTLAELIKNKGYDTAAISANPLLKEYLGFSQGFDRYQIGEHDWRAERVHSTMTHLFNKTYFGQTRPFFLYLHYMDPHEPYNPPKNFRKFKGKIVPKKSKASKQVVSKGFNSFKYSKKVQAELNLYDAEIKYLDFYIGKLIDFLKFRNIYDNSIIVFTADHGEQFKEHGRMRHGGSVFNPEIWVPMMIKAPQLGRSQVPNTVSIIDLFPTILDLLEIEYDGPCQGYSLISELEERRSQPVLAEATLYTHEKAIIDHSGAKLRALFSGPNYQAVERKQLKSSHIYLSSTMIQERPNVAAKERKRKLIKRFWALYEETLAHRAKWKTEETKELNEVTVRQLKALGYL